MSEVKEKVKEEGSFKIKKKPGRPKKLNKQEDIIKLDLSKKEENAVEEQTTDEVLVRDEPEVSKEVSKENIEETIEELTEQSQEKEEVITINEITEEKEKIKETVLEQATEPVLQQKQLPENIEKLVKFMEETGGTVEDYVRLNADYSSVDENTLIREYYKQTKPHLDVEEVNFLLEDNFSYDQEVDEERDIKKKKLAFKEEIAKARKFLEDTKSKYYDEIKLWTFSIDTTKNRKWLKATMTDLN